MEAIDKQLFELATLASVRIPRKDVIGTKSEHRIHGTLKYYFQPNDAFHELKLDGFICDAADEQLNEIFEVQTRAFDRLRKKLSTLLLSHPVTVIYPVVTKKRIITTYEADGQAFISHSPKKASYFNIFDELYKIKELLPYPLLKIKAVEIKIDEFRVFAGTKETRKPFQKPLSVEKIPTELLQIRTVTYPYSYLALLPDTLPDRFNSTDLATALSTSRQTASLILHLLTELNFVIRTARNKKGYIYTFELTRNPSFG